MKTRALVRGQLFGSTVLMSAMLVSAPAWAQENPAQEVVDEGNINEGEVSANADGSAADDEVVVTGSRIRRPDLTSSSPVTVATAAEIGVSGSVANVEDFLNELPQFVPGTTGASNNPGNGLATINLRGAGVARTLVLVDGKRYIPATLGGVVDINTVPTPLVERVEVVTGGASAVYGSDALAGVVNFVLKRDFSGVELNGQYNVTERGDSTIFTTSATIGGNFAEGRGNAALLLGYTDREAAFASDRAYSRTVLLDSVPALNAAGTTASGGCVPGSLNEFGLGQRVAPGPASTLGNRVACFVPGGSGGIPSLLLPGLPIGPTTFNPDGTARPFIDPDDLFNFAPANYLQLPQERFLGTAIARYEISPAVEVFGRGVFAYNEVPRQLASTPVSNVFNFNLGNPFLTPSARTALCSTIDTNTTLAGTQSPTAAQCAQFVAEDRLINGVSISRRQEEVGPRQNPQKTYSFQIQAGLRGEILPEFLNYEASYQYARSSVNTRVANDVSFDRFQNSILVVRDASGNAVCRDAAARAAGCVPQNIFGAGNVSQAAANYIRLGAQSTTEVKEEVANITFDGLAPITLLSDEQIGFAFGGEYRAITGRFDPDEALQRQVLGFNRTSPTRGRYDVKEVFGELSIPIISERFLYDVRATGALRYSDYSTVGGVTTYSAGLEIAPIRDIRFRGQLQRAIRAPGIGELFAGQGNSFPAAVDVCSSRQPEAQRAAVRQACITSGIPADRVFVFPGNTQVETLIGGNPNLGEETSDTYTVGAVVSPTFLPGFNATVDYYNISIDDAIATFGGGTANIINTCYGPQVAGDPTNPFCAAIVRRADSTIQNVSSINANIASIKLEGVDFGVDYRTALPFGLYDDETAFAIIIRGTRTLEQTSRADPTNRIINCVGFYGALCGQPTPKWRLANSASFSTGPIGLTIQHRWFDDTFDDRQNRFPNPDAVPPVEELFTPIDRPSSKIGDYHIFDASLNFDVSDNYELTFGIENVFDRRTPVPGDGADEQNNTFPSVFDPFGRSFFVAGKIKF